jgi:hypothetical protein
VQVHRRHALSFIYQCLTLFSIDPTWFAFNQIYFLFVTTPIPQEEARKVCLEKKPTWHPHRARKNRHSCLKRLWKKILIVSNDKFKMSDKNR